jgi:hypothetical protein
MKTKENIFLSSKASEIIVSNPIVLTNIENNLCKHMNIPLFQSIWATPFGIKEKPNESLILLIIALKNRDLINRVVVPDNWINFFQKEEKFEFRYCGYLAVTKFSDWKIEKWDYPRGEAILLIPPMGVDLENDVFSKFPKLLWLLLPSQTSHLTHPERLFFDDFEHQISMEALLERLT